MDTTADYACNNLATIEHTDQSSHKLGFDLVLLNDDCDDDDATGSEEAPEKKRHMGQQRYHIPIWELQWSHSRLKDFFFK